MADKTDKKPKEIARPTSKESVTNPVPPVDALPPEVRDFVLSLPPDKRQQATRVLIQITRTTTSHVGPIPSAEALAQYGLVLESAPDRILRMAEKQSDHRMELEKSTIRRQLNQSGIGQILAFLVSLGCIGASSWLAVEDHDAAETRVSRRRSYPVRPAYPPKTRQPLPGAAAVGKHRIRFKLGRLPPRLRDGGYFGRG